MVKKTPAKSAPRPTPRATPPAPAPKPAAGTALVTAEDQAALDEMINQSWGAGTSTAPEDNLIPSILILQPLSPQVLDGPSQVEGAEAGDILLGGTNELIDGEEGIWFQPCEGRDAWLEFIPRDAGGGFQGSWDFEPGKIDRKHLPDRAEFRPGSTTKAVFTETGNECTHYHFLAGILWRGGTGLEFNIPFKSTGHTVARGWNTKRLRQRIHGRPLAAFGCLYPLRTVQKKNKKGQWYMFEVGDPVPVKFTDGHPNVGQLNPEFQKIVGNVTQAFGMAMALEQAVASGKKRMAAPDQDIEPDDGSGEGGEYAGGEGDAADI